MWDSGQQEMQQISGYASEFMNMTLPAAEDMFEWAATQRDRFNEYVMPQMESLFQEAELYASKGEEDRQRGMAIQDVKAATEAERESQLRKLESYGIDPSETRYQSLDKQAGVAEAALSALAANQAGERTKQIGRDLRADAINVGTGFLTDATNSMNTGVNAGTAGANVGNAAAQTGVAVQQGALPFMAGAGNSTSGAAGIVDTGYGRDLDYAEDQRAAEADLTGMGNLLGLGASFIPGVGPMIAPTLDAINAADGGPVSAPGGPTSDGGALKISDGEYIVPADVVRKLGTNHFDKLIEKETGRPPPGTKQAIPVGAV